MRDGAGLSPLRVTPTPPPDGADRRVRGWDESTRPSGPAPDPGRLYSAGDQRSAQHLVDIHDHLRAELAQVQDMVAQVVAGAVDPGTARSHLNAMTMRQNAWVLGSYCQSYCRVVAMHHGIEDQAVFPHLRRGDARLAPVLDRLEQEHHVVHDLLEGVDQALVAAVTTPDAMPGLQAAVDVLADSLLSHLAYEERELVEPIARLQMGLS
jgi:hypothetical protein